MVLQVDGVVLPSPTEMTVGDEIIWSSNTGRSADGTMVGDVITEKKNISVSWGILTESEVRTIQNALSPGFHTLTFRDAGMDLTISQYRGTLTKQPMGYIGDGIYYYKSVTVSIIQQ